MKKIYVLDTNVLLADPYSIFSFDDNHVVVPTVVLQELDNQKTRMDEVGRTARHVSKLIDSLRERGRLNEGVDLDNGGTLQVVNNQMLSEVYESFHEDTADNRIIGVAYKLTNSRDEEVVLVSRDILVRVKADSLGVKAEDYESDKVMLEDSGLYTGFIEIDDIPHDVVGVIKHGGRVKCPDWLELHPNQYVVLNRTVVAVKRNGYLEKSFIDYGTYVYGISPRNEGQMMALDLLMRDDVPIVTLVGKAGTGKTLLALAAGLAKVQDDGKYRKVNCYRSIVPVGNDLGFLPGEMEEKLRPWTQPIYDSLEHLFNTKENGNLENIMAGMQDELEIGALTYIRGRSIPEQFIIIDEAQNLTKHEIKTILTRAGEKTKVVIMGDPEQIDHPYLDQYSNGLTYVVEKMKDQELAGHVTLTKGERSTLAQLCADIL